MKRKLCALCLVFCMAASACGGGKEISAAEPSQAGEAATAHSASMESEKALADEQNDGSLQWRNEKANVGTCWYTVAVPLFAKFEYTQATSWCYTDLEQAYIYIVDGYAMPKEEPYEGTDITELPAVLEDSLIRATSTYHGVRESFWQDDAEFREITVDGMDILRAEQTFQGEDGAQWLYIGYYTFVNNPERKIINAPVYWGVFLNLDKDVDRDMATEYADAMADTFELQ